MGVPGSGRPRTARDVWPSANPFVLSLSQRPSTEIASSSGRLFAMTVEEKTEPACHPEQTDRSQFSDVTESAWREDGGLMRLRRSAEEGRQLQHHLELRTDEGHKVMYFGTALGRRKLLVDHRSDVGYITQVPPENVDLRNVGSRPAGQLHE